MLRRADELAWSAARMKPYLLDRRIDASGFLRDDGPWTSRSSAISPTSRRSRSVEEFESVDAFNGGTAKDGGESGRVELKSGSQTAQFETPNSTGTKRPASAGRN